MSDVALPHRGPACPPALHLEAHAAQEAAPAVAAHLPGCQACAAYVTALRHEQDAFLRQHTWELFRLKVRARPARSRPLRLLFAVPALAAALAAVVALTRPPDDVRLKGSRAFTVVYKREGMPTALPVAGDQRLRAGDALRFSFRAERDGYLAVLDLDGRGKATAFYPYAGAHSVPLSAAHDDFLPGSVVLDAAPGPEWLVAVFTAEPFELAPLLAQLEQTSPAADRVQLRCGACQVEALRVLKAP